LLGFGEEIVDTAIQHESTDPPNGHVLLRDDLGRIEDIEGELRRELLIEELQPELPLGVVTRLNGVPQIAAMEIGIGPVDLHRFVPDD
jgi:hypothetical protein